MTTFPILIDGQQHDIDPDDLSPVEWAQVALDLAYVAGVKRGIPTDVDKATVIAFRWLKGRAMPDILIRDVMDLPPEDLEQGREGVAA